MDTCFLPTQTNYSLCPCWKQREQNGSVPSIVHMTSHSTAPTVVRLSQGRGGGKNLEGSAWNSAPATWNVCQPALLLHLSLLNPVMGSVHPHFHFWSRLDCLVVCVMRKRYVGGANTWYEVVPKLVFPSHAYERVSVMRHYYVPHFPLSWWGPMCCQRARGHIPPFSWSC